MEFKKPKVNENVIEGSFEEGNEDDKKWIIKLYQNL